LSRVPDSTRVTQVFLTPWGERLQLGDEAVLKRAEVERERRKTREQLGERQRLRDAVLFIEYLRYGKLDTWLAKAAVMKKPFPDEALWQIFECCEFARVR
jgi:hypothetical protein